MLLENCNLIGCTEQKHFEVVLIMVYGGGEIDVGK